MAKVNLDPMIKGLRGKLGNYVYRLYPNGNTVISKAPDMSNVAWSAAQQAHRQRFKAAIAYAKAAMAQPEIAEGYRRAALNQGKRAFFLAVSDYFQGNNLLEK